MPEGDTVWRAARNLNRALAGAVVTSSEFRVPQLALASVTGVSILEVVAAGKHILMRLSDGRTLHSHLRMDGDWQLFKQPARPPAPAHEIRVVLSTDSWAAFGMRLHDLVLLPTEKEGEQVGHLGPDLLADPCDLGLVASHVSADPRSIAEALLDQRNVAGIGNIYKSEVLFLGGVSPFMPASSVPDVAALVRNARRLLRANREHPEQSTTGSLRRGETHWVYGRAGKPCRRCGATVQVDKQGDPTYERVTYWCPRCQPSQ